MQTIDSHRSHTDREYPTGKRERTSRVKDTRVLDTIFDEHKPKLRKTEQNTRLAAGSQQYISYPTAREMEVKQKWIDNRSEMKGEIRAQPWRHKTKQALRFSGSWKSLCDRPSCDVEPWSGCIHWVRVMVKGMDH